MEVYALTNFNSSKFKMTVFRPQLTLISLISGELCHIDRSLGTMKENVRLQGVICPEKCQLDQIQNG